MRRASGKSAVTPTAPYRGITIATRKRASHLLFHPTAWSFHEISGLSVLNSFFTGERFDGFELRPVPSGDLFIGLAALLVHITRQCLDIRIGRIDHPQIPVGLFPHQSFRLGFFKRHGVSRGEDP